MRTKPVERVSKTSLQVLVERCLRSFLVIVRNELIENAPVARLFDVCGNTNDQPMWIIVKSAADIVVSPFGERLVLVVRAAGWQLCCRQIQYPFASARGNHVHKSQQVLVGVAKA